MKIKKFLVFLFVANLLSGCYYIDPYTNSNSGKLISKDYTLKSISSSLENFTIDKILKTNTLEEGILSNLSLPKEYDSYDVKWLTSSTSINLDTGKVIRGSSDSSIILTGRFTDKKTGIYIDKSFNLLIKNRDAELIDFSFVQGGTYNRDCSFGAVKQNATITYNYYIEKHEVTFKEMDRYCIDNNIPFFKDTNKYETILSRARTNYPAINITWWDCIKYCNWLSDCANIKRAYNEISGDLIDSNGVITNDITKVLGYRLPTEAEWEFAAIGGIYSLSHINSDLKDYKFSGSNTLDDVGYNWKSQVINNNQTFGIESLVKNELGLYDMTGNVWEWTTDWFNEDIFSLSHITNPYNYQKQEKRVMKGGSFQLYPDLKASSISTSTDLSDDQKFEALYLNMYHFAKGYPDRSSFEIGFRIVRKAE